MTFDQVEQRVRALRRSMGKGKLSRKAYVAQVLKLGVTHTDGSRWRIDPSKGSWTRWDGARWVESRPPRPAAKRATAPARSSPAKRRRKAKAKPPESLVDLFSMVLKGILKNLLWEIPLGLVLFLLVWVFHTYVLVRVNEGFGPGGAGGYISNLFQAVGLSLSSLPLGNQVRLLFTTVVDGIIATRGKGIVTGTLFWMLFMSLISGALFRFFRLGPAKYLSGIFGTPGWMGRTVKGTNSAGVAMGCVVAGGSAGLAAAVVCGHPAMLGSRVLTFTLFLTVLSILFARMETLTMLVARLAWSDAQRAAGGEKGKTKPMNPAYALSVLVGLSGGLCIGSLLPFLFFCGCTGALLLFFLAAGLILLPLISKGKAPPGPARALLFLVCALLVASVVVPVYADDGGWQEAGGTFQSWVNSQGAVQAVAQGIPPSLGAVIGTIMGAISAAAGAAAAAGGAAGAVGGGAGASGAGAAGGKAGEGGIKDFSQGQKDAKDLIAGFLGTESGGNLLKAGLSKVFKAGDTVKKFKDLLASETKVLEGGMVEIKNMASYEKTMKEMLDAGKNVSKWVKRVGDGCTSLGVLFDAVSNMAQGDSWYYGIGKASGAGAIMAKLTEKNPALAAMEFANFLGFGGSTASKCISPTQNITGAYNYLVDKFTDLANGTDKANGRISKGKYGENMKNLDLGMKMIAEGWQDPKTMGKDLTKFVTDNKTWDDMYSQSYKVWKPPKGAWLPKRLACGTGELITDGVIKAGELTAKAAKGAGRVWAAATSKISSWFHR